MVDAVLYSEIQSYPSCSKFNPPVPVREAESGQESTSQYKARHDSKMLAGRILGLTTAEMYFICNPECCLESQSEANKACKACTFLETRVQAPSRSSNVSGSLESL